MGVTGSNQLSFAGLESAGELSLRQTTFVVVDLETTGGRATGTEQKPPDAITEIGAVKVRGGAVLGEFATLVDPQRSIPPQIVQLTGITSAMVCDAPTIDAVLPMFLEFARDSVLVAHNAGFDVGFLRAAAQRCNIAWPRPPVLCTVRLARRVLSREEAPSVRLAALARLFTARLPAHPPRPRRRPRHRRRVAHPHRASRQPGRAHLRRPARVSAERDSDPAPQKSARPGIAAPAGGLSIPRPVGRGALRRHRGRLAAPGKPILHRRRHPRPDEGDGHAGRRGRPCRVRARTGGRCAGTADAGRTRPAVQPPVEVSAALVVGGAHRRGVSAAFGAARAAARSRRRPVSVPGRCRRNSGAAGAVHRAAHLYRAVGAVGAARARLSPSWRCRPARPPAT